METALIMKLNRFFKKVENRLANPKKNRSTCRLILCYIEIISEALIEGDDVVATTISNWMKDNREKFRFCATEDSFEKITKKIDENLQQVLKPAEMAEISAETNGVNGFNKKNQKHSHDLLLSISSKAKF